jgi:hypothetical protein
MTNAAPRFAEQIAKANTSFQASYVERARETQGLFADAVNAWTHFIEQNRSEGQDFVGSLTEYGTARWDAIQSSVAGASAESTVTRLAEQDKGLYRTLAQRFAGFQDSQAALIAALADLPVATLRAQQLLLRDATKYGESVYDAWQDLVAETVVAESVKA